MIIGLLRWLTIVPDTLRRNHVIVLLDSVDGLVLRYGFGKGSVVIIAIIVFADKLWCIRLASSAHARGINWQHTMLSRSKVCTRI